jgi:hypothetical protein
MAGIDFNLLHQLFEYKNGLLFRKKRVSSRAKIGLEAGSFDKEGYKKVQIYYKSYRVHRLIFMMFYGYMPKFVDHINNNRGDNRIENLREATSNQNQHNSKKPKTNTTGFKNVYFSKASQNWYVQIKINRKVISVYRLENAEIADLVAQELRNKHHKDFARHK